MSETSKLQRNVADSTANRRRTAISTETELPRPVAVIDIGASAIRMAIAEINPNGEVRKLDQLIQPVPLGKETFETRRLSRRSIERVVSVLTQYQRILLEYGIDQPSSVRVVATSAVREASNRLAFADRVFMETGLHVQPIDEAEVNRITYMGITPQLLADEELSNGKAMVLEVGGGSTEVLVVRSGNVLASHSYRLGSIRMLQTIDLARAGAKRRRALLENHINRMLTQLNELVRSESQLNLVAVGGDIRLATRLINPQWKRRTLTKVPTEKLVQLTDDILTLDEEEIVKRFGATFIEAQTLAPALLAYSAVARHFSLEHIYVSDTNMRDGLLKDMAAEGRWTAEFRNQIIRSALSLGRRFHFDEMHARSVAELSRKLFDQLRPQHRLDNRHEVILYVAALLHEIGMQINIRGHHKHSLYIIRHSELFGLSQSELVLVALVARYYRRATPQPTHSEYMSLDREHRVLVSKLAAILRLAAALDDTRTSRIREIDCKVEGNRLIIEIPGVSDVSLEQIAMKQQAGLFRDVYGLPVMLRVGG
ncbi:Ppx/GppA phosphatase family protein [Roseiconus lacunae]|uniref:Ppx/GppA phosphatase family protein n=1 Tax=Roseiconus lacunae TaxID=2605694 RepID=A0ABT7PR70_9BACT|nr:Ppx/GppA phosphatase family protein [Roseiconus lacunae]MCD0460137.1 Ppx/GppA family phosphatase [Roseiconus lacunae]MDM4018769.1 Ppx/GppA phosphatase family protein [Roseiconus lacunae]WRQ50602.1 Ppx/GppA phosphatase family protein [Stieleria sp. HD01]